MLASDIKLDFVSWSRWRRFKAIYPTFIELLRPNKDDVILDVGAGTGVIADKVASLCDEVFALEPQTNRVNYVRRKFSQVKVFQAFAEGIPFPEDYFTKIYVIYAFHHFGNPELALSEFERISKPGGLLLIQEMNPWGILSRLETRFSKHNFHTAGSLQEKVEFAGFETVRVQKTRKGYFLLCQRP